MTLRSSGLRADLFRGARVEASKRAVFRENAAPLVQLDRIRKDFGKLNDQELLDATGDLFVFDVESYPNFFSVAFKHVKSGKYQYFELSDTCELWRKKLWFFMWNYCVVGFNSIHYDIPILMIALQCEWLKAPDLFEITQRIIEQGERPSDILEEFGVNLPRINHIDLKEVAPLDGSLKLYGARLHTSRLQDLPFKPQTVLTADQMEVVRLYNLNDLDMTEDLLNELMPQLSLRNAMTKRYKQDLRSKSDAQIAEAVIREKIKEVTGKAPTRPSIPVGTIYHYEAPSFLSFSTPVMQNAFETVKSSDFVIGNNGSPILPPQIKALKIKLGNSIYRMGIGGLHSSEENEAHETQEFGSDNTKFVVSSDNEHYLIDRDVTSYYPMIILTQRYSPKHLGNNFLPIYGSIVDERIAAKNAKMTVEADSLKIVINGSFGKFGSMFSILYSPDLMLQVTITGQLSLMMLIEWLELSRIPVVSANTDGIVIKCPKSKYDTMLQIFEHWEKTTGFSTEETRYKALYSRDVNNYIALKLKFDKANNCWTDEIDGYKGKGAYSNPWEKKGNNIFKLHKNPAGTICIEAAVNMLIKGTPLIQTIQACDDITKFLYARTVKGGAHRNGVYLGKVVRWYYGEGEREPMRYVLSGNKVPKTDGCKPCMDIPDSFPPDIDYRRYVEEAEGILLDIGYLKGTKTATLF